jgi:hypothetical protein
VNFVLSFEDAMQAQAVGSERLELELEAELRNEAAGLPDDCWRTGAFQSLVQALETGSAETFGTEMWQLLDAAECGYDEFVVCREEITMESAVSHRLLLEGIDAWREALEILPQRPRAALKLAEHGNRLLVTLEQLSRRMSVNY